MSKCTHMCQMPGTILKKADSERRAGGRGRMGKREGAFLYKVVRWAFLPLGPK